MTTTLELPANLSTLAPPAFDELVKAAWFAAGKADQLVDAQMGRIKRAIGAQTEWRGSRQFYRVSDREALEQAEAKINEPAAGSIRRNVGDVLSDYRAAVEARDAIYAQEATLQAEYDRRPWPRYMATTGSGAHIHKDMHCSTCNRGRYRTAFAFLTELSGTPIEQAISQFQTTLCTVCFPDAPVAPVAPRKTREELAAERAAAAERARAEDPKLIADVDGRPLRVDGDMLRTVRSAELAALRALDWAVYGRHIGDPNEEYAQQHEGHARQIVAALAHKRGTTVDDEMAALVVKAVAKAKKAYGKDVADAAAAVWARQAQDAADKLARQESVAAPGVEASDAEPARKTVAPAEQAGRRDEITARIPDAGAAESYRAPLAGDGRHNIDAVSRATGGTGCLRCGEDVRWVPGPAEGDPNAGRHEHVHPDGLASLLEPDGCVTRDVTYERLAELAGVDQTAGRPLIDGDGLDVPIGPDKSCISTDSRLFFIGRVRGRCGHYMAASERRAGMTTCERCPNHGGDDPDADAELDERLAAADDEIGAALVAAAAKRQDDPVLTSVLQTAGEPIGETPAVDVPGQRVGGEAPWLSGLRDHVVQQTRAGLSDLLRADGFVSTFVLGVDVPALQHPGDVAVVVDSDGVEITYPDAGVADGEAGEGRGVVRLPFGTAYGAVRDVAVGLVAVTGGTAPAVTASRDQVEQLLDLVAQYGQAAALGGHTGRVAAGAEGVERVAAERFAAVRSALLDLVAAPVDLFGQSLARDPEIQPQPLSPVLASALARRAAPPYDVDDAGDELVIHDGRGDNEHGVPLATLAGTLRFEDFEGAEWILEGGYGRWGGEYDELPRAKRKAGQLLAAGLEYGQPGEEPARWIHHVGRLGEWWTPVFNGDVAQDDARCVGREPVADDDGASL